MNFVDILGGEILKRLQASLSGFLPSAKIAKCLAWKLLKL